MTVKTKIYFARPQPLSPNETHSSAVYGADGRWYRRAGKGKLVLAKSVPISECIYYWWFEYLKRSDKYKSACANGGKGMQKLYNDFGNIYEVEFWDWWKEKGVYLFGERRAAEIDEFITLEDAIDLRQEIEEGKYVLVAIPTNLKKTSIQKQLGMLLKELEVKPAYSSKAKYPLTKTKVDANSLSDCLYAYELKLSGKSNVEIGAMLSKSATELEEFKRDARAKGKDVDYKVLRKYLNNNSLDTDLDEYDRQNEEGASVFFKVGKDRTASKNYLNVKASRMIKKALANIAAVEKGNFPVGHLLKPK